MLHMCWYAVHSSWYMSWYFCYAPYGSCTWTDICVGTLRTLPGTWVDVFAATLLMVHVHEVAYMLVTELKKRGTKNWGWWGAQSPANTIGSVFWVSSSWHRVAIFQRSMFAKHCEGCKKTLHAAAENVDFVRDLETPSYLCGYMSPRVTSFVAIFSKILLWRTVTWFFLPHWYKSLTRWNQNIWLWAGAERGRTHNVV